MWIYMANISRNKVFCKTVKTLIRQFFYNIGMPLVKCTGIIIHFIKVVSILNSQSLFFWGESDHLYSKKNKS